MKKRHSFARVIVAGSFALVALITAAASATVSTDATPTPVHIDRANVPDNQLFMFN
ncbi:hypothetical protein [Azospirillum doebereinerae]